MGVEGLFRQKLLRATSGSFVIFLVSRLRVLGRRGSGFGCWDALRFWGWEVEDLGCLRAGLFQGFLCRLETN